MKRYEILVLTVPEITQDEQKQLEKQMDDVINKNKGTVVSFERWGKFRLAYQVKNNDYGVYYLIRFEADSSADVLKDLKTLFAVKLHNIVMRYMVTKLDMNESLVYQRPRSLEETPARDTFLHDNKVKGILASVESKKKRADVKTDQQATDDLKAEVKQTAEGEQSMEKEA